MSDPNWMSANIHHRESVLSKGRTDFGAEASSRSTHFCGVEAGGRNTILRRLIGLLRRWRERAHSRPDLCELDNRILQDIGLRRDALLGSPTK